MRMSIWGGSCRTFGERYKEHLKGWLHAAHSAVPQPFHDYGEEYNSGDSAECHPIPPPSPHGGEGSSFSGCVPPDGMANSQSVVDIKPSDSGVVIGYQVDECTHTRSGKNFVAWSHIYPAFTGKVSALTDFPLEPGYRDYSLLGPSSQRPWAWFWFHPPDPIESPELDASFDEADTRPSLVSSGFLYLVITISDISKL